MDSMTEVASQRKWSTLKGPSTRMSQCAGEIAEHNSGLAALTS
nr:hypothetical protein [Ferrimicrobium acidiphilum]